VAGTIEKRMTLRDQVTPTMNKINRGTLEYKKNLRDLRSVGNATWSGIKVGIATMGVAVVGGIVGIIAASRGWEEEAKASIDAQTKLYAILKNVKGVTDAQTTSLYNYAQAQQQVGVVDGDVITSGVQQVGTFQLQTATIKKLIPGMADLLAQQKGLNATQGDAVSIGNLLGKAMAGNTGSLSKVGIIFTEAQKKILKFGNEQERASTLAEVLKQNVGGVNAALAATDQGKIQQATNAIGDMKETLGTTSLFIKAQFAKVFMDNFPQINAKVNDVSASIQTWAENGGVTRIVNGMQSVWTGIQDVWNVGVNTFNFFKNNWSLISPIVYGIVGAFAAYKTALVVTRTWALLTTGATVLQTIATKGLNAAMRANPIGFVVTLLGLLVVAGMYVINNWELVKLVGMKVWNSVVGAAQWAVNAYITYANFMLKVYKFAFDSIAFAGISIWNIIIDAGQAGVNGFIGLIEKMVEKSLGGINKLIKGANSASKALGFGNVMSELTFSGLGRVDFSGAKGNATAPKWDKNLNLIPKVNFSGAQFGEDAIMKQTNKAKAERDKKTDANKKSLDDNTNALLANSKSTDENTDSTDGLGGTLKNGVAVNMTGDQIADSLVPRLQRHLYGTD
jgi:hypothetical protein